MALHGWFGSAGQVRRGDLSFVLFWFGGFWQVGYGSARFVEFRCGKAGMEIKRRYTTWNLSGKMGTD